MKTPTTFQRFLAATLMLLASWAHAANEPAMVADVQGQVSTGKGGRLEILAFLPADTRLSLAPQAKVVLVYPASSREYELAGPGDYQVGKAAPEALRGAKPATERVLGTVYGVRRINTASKAQAGMVMRSVMPPSYRLSIQLLEPSGSLVMNERPVFRWEDMPGGGRYRFVLSDDQGKIVAAGNVKGSSFVLPKGVTLKEKTAYSWSVEARDGTEGSHQFTLIGKDERQRLEQLRPAADAPFAQRLLYAAELEGLGLRDEAKPLWKTLAAERPEDSRLQDLAGE